MLQTEVRNMGSQARIEADVFCHELHIRDIDKNRRIIYRIDENAILRYLIRQ